MGDDCEGSEDGPGWNMKIAEFVSEQLKMTDDSKRFLLNANTIILINHRFMPW